MNLQPLVMEEFMRTRMLAAFCRNGHKMAGPNLLWHTRYDATGKQFLVRECRTCANDRYRARRRAKRRNWEMEQEAVETVAGAPGFRVEVAEDL